MDIKEVREIRRKIESLIRQRRIFEALAALENYTKGAMLFELTDRVDKLLQTYRYMLQYFTSGVDDPGRNRLLHDITAGTYGILDSFEVRATETDTPTLYYNVRRFNRMPGRGVSIVDGIARWNEARKRALSMSNLFNDASMKDSAIATTLESIESTLFNSLWTSFPLADDERDAAVGLICDENTPLTTSVRLTSALTLAALEFVDSNAVIALCEIYGHFNDKDDERSRSTAAAALLGIIFALYKAGDRTLPANVTNRVNALTDLPRWGEDVRTAFIELVRSRDTERISHTMTDEILPEVMAMRSDIEKKVRDLGEVPSLGALEDGNPEWEELFSKSEIGDKLKELNRLQMEGSDVYMSTFAHLKNFPFFNDIINWFTPFAPEAYFIEKTVGDKPELNDVIDFIGSLPFLCDSDRYSILLSVSLINDAGRNNMLSQLAAQREEIAEFKAHSEGLTRRDNRASDLRNHIRNFYRFVNLFRRKGEFYNIFSSEINLFNVPLLKSALEDSEILRIVGEFYFRYKYYGESLTAFSILDEMGEFDSVLYQKMGYAYENTGDIEAAIRFYEQADLLDENSKWLKYRLAKAYLKGGRTPEAIEKFKSLLADDPEHSGTILSISYAYIADNNFREALKYLYKAEFLNDGENDPRIIRAIAWSLFQVRDFERAARYYERLLKLGAVADDYFNMGHVALALGNFREALNYYKTFLDNAENDNAKDESKGSRAVSPRERKARFLRALAADREHLRHAGIADDVVALISDALLSGI